MRILTIGFVLLISAHLSAQTALNSVPPYLADFGQGMNFGWFDNWTDEDLARLSTGSPDGSIPGIGVNAIRPGLFAWFLEQHGYSVRTDAFDTYAQLGMKDNVVIIGFPSNAQRSDEVWCADGQRSELFKGMWEPIWDDNNGTPWNENNTYADYLYKAVELYGDEVSFWEVWNEPDINYSGNGWKDRSYEGNWFDNDPDPCELMIHAPVQAYVRMLRITYEVVKRLQPTDYVAVGGLGYPSFLDAILRKTDEKSSGAVTPDHPLTGGAYFDAMSFHVYPHVDGAFREWNNNEGDWDYTRNSDVGVRGVEKKFQDMNAVLEDYGFSGAPYPEKVWLCTESNLPRRGFTDPSAANASEVMQRNFAIKVLAKAQQWGLAQFHPYQLADSEPGNSATFEYHTMGFYYYIDHLSSPTQAQAAQAGIAYRTYGKLLRGARYSSALTSALDLPAGAEGVGFTTPSGKTAYVLWAVATQDGNEYPSLSYNLTGDLAAGNHLMLDWDYSVSNVSRPATGTVQLSGAPSFFIHNTEVDGASSVDTNQSAASKLALWPNPVDNRLVVKVPAGNQNWRLEIFDMVGRSAGIPPLLIGAGGGARELSVDLLVPGAYLVRATSGNEVLVSSFVKA